MRSLSLLPIVSLLLSSQILAQQDHDLYHGDYQHWANKLGMNCCDNRHCGTIADSDVREMASSIEVRIDGQWCPVKPWHYLKSGNAPNWATAHVCVNPDQAATVCDRLICYQPKPAY